MTTTFDPNVSVRRIKEKRTISLGFAIPWLLLKMVSNDGPGIFSRVTFIERVNTVGGLRPTVPSTTVGEEKRVPYTAEYNFYRAE